MEAGADPEARDARVIGTRHAIGTRGQDPDDATPTRATVLARTRRGAAALLDAVSALPPTAWRLLARLNGYSDLGTLLAFGPGGADEALAAARRLLDDGLACVVETGLER